MKFSVDGFVEVLGTIDLLQCFSVDRVAADTFLLPSVCDSDDLSLVRVNSINQSVSHLSMSSCNLSASAGELMFRKQSSANRLQWTILGLGVIGVTQEDNGTANCPGRCIM